MSQPNVLIYDNASEGGGFVPPRVVSSRIRNPANRDDLIGLFPDSTIEDATAAIESGARRL
jgi:hypothetical protein